MTLKELSQLYYLNREIEMDKKRLLELEARAVSCSSDLSGCPWSPGVGARGALMRRRSWASKGIIEAKLSSASMSATVWRGTSPPLRQPPPAGFFSHIALLGMDCRGSRWPHVSGVTLLTACG